jgi:hypothetical protein
LSSTHPGGRDAAEHEAVHRFVTSDNAVRPHRTIGRRAAAEAFAARDKSHPLGSNIDSAAYRVRNDKVNKNGTLKLR